MEVVKLMERCFVEKRLANLNEIIDAMDQDLQDPEYRKKTTPEFIKNFEELKEEKDDEKRQELLRKMLRTTSD